jgi:uncharacterized protein HemY
MIALGIFVLVAVTLVSLVVIFRGNDPVQIDLHYFNVDTSVGFVYIAGAVALALLAFGLSLFWEGLKRSRRRRKETKQLRSQVASSSGTSTGGTPLGSTSTEKASTGGASASGGPAGPDDHFDTAPRER